MPLHIPLGFAQVTIPLKHANISRPAAITFGIDLTGSSVLPGLIPDAAFNAWAAAWLTSLDENVLAGPAYSLQGTASGENAPVTGSQTGQGGRSMGSTNASNAAIMEKRTSRPGRRGKGRFYMPWVLQAIDVQESGVLVQAQIDALNAIGATMLGELEDPARNIPMVLLHNKTDLTPPTVNLDPTRVTNLTCDGIIGVQRRRLNR